MAPAPLLAASTVAGAETVQPAPADGERKANMSKAKRHNDGGTCCECGGAHECEACPTFDAPKVATKAANRTPGPWFAKKGDTLNADRTWGVVVPLTREECEEIDGDDSGFDANGDGRTVVVAEVCDTSTDDGEADARLIAAAPTMYETMVEFLRVVDALGERNVLDGWPVVSEALAPCRSAIAKARGE